MVEWLKQGCDDRSRSKTRETTGDGYSGESGRASVVDKHLGVEVALVM